MGIFGEHVRRLREQASKSMRAMADAVGVSVVYISDIERGRRNPPQGEKLARMAQCLEVDVNDLEEIAAKERRRVELELSEQDSVISDAALTLARRWDSITSEEASQIIKLLSKEERKHDG